MKISAIKTQQINVEGPSPSSQSSTCNLTICSRLAVLRGKVDSSPNPAPRVGHDPQARFEYGRYHSYIGAVPEEATIVHLVMLTEPYSLIGERRSIL